MLIIAGVVCLEPRIVSQKRNRKNLFDSLDPTFVSEEQTECENVLSGQKPFREGKMARYYGRARPTTHL